MQKIKAISLIFFGALLAYIASNLFQPTDNLDQQILDVALSDTVSVVGFRNNNGNATVSYSYNFYVRSEGEELPSPFLISGTPDVNVTAKGADSFALDITGKIYQFTNIVWINKNGSLLPIHVELVAKNG
ncbi:hypothetical protein [Vibrio mangrovi]|uniref:Uncharacterized protein n=1 Tax=Vibrio mangrovi TaxID=474394 RepID=A0A1Y6IPM8_9VIBR|nr:hypothetical protein [Vibrio mangrovi]MDW6004182.1 hypothetical protein [Vibrio mangrovi]SMR99021.1 hypothetical protein VIM7927_00243 [Vibrio mangrovi]